MKTRVISGIIIAIVLAAVLIPGGYVLAATLLAVSFISYFELTRATGVHEEGKRVNALEACGYLAIIVHYIQMVIVRDYSYYIFSVMFAFFLTQYYHKITKGGKL